MRRFDDAVITTIATALSLPAQFVEPHAEKSYTAQTREGKDGKPESQADGLAPVYRCSFLGLTEEAQADGLQQGCRGLILRLTQNKEGAQADGLAPVYRCSFLGLTEEAQADGLAQVGRYRISSLTHKNSIRCKRVSRPLRNICKETWIMSPDYSK